MPEKPFSENAAEIISKLCEHLESTLSSYDFTEEQRESILNELSSMRELGEDVVKFTSEYPQLTTLFGFTVNMLVEHEKKLELLKDALVANGLLVQVEAESKEEAIAMAKKTLEEEMLSDMLAKVDKTTVH